MVVEAVIGSEVFCVAVIVPAQLSLAVGGIKLVTEHSEVTIGKVATSAKGAETSLITTSCVWVRVFPFPSS